MKTLTSKRHETTFTPICLLALFILFSTQMVHAQSPRNVFRRVMPSVVLVEAEKKSFVHNVSYTQSPDVNIGSGVLISNDGKVLTAASVVDDARNISVVFFNGSRIPARVIKISATADIAVLELERVPANALVATLGDSTQAAIGEEVFVVGSAAGVAQSLSVGFISGRVNDEKPSSGASAVEMLQVDAALKVGNSGGPVFNLKGEVIGLISHTLTKSNQANKVGLAVTSNVVRQLLADLQKNK